MRYDFCAPRFGDSISVPGNKVLINDDLRKCVVFIGVSGDESKGGIDCIGTGFLLSYEGIGYLVTAQHVAASLGDDPYLIRLNKTGGGADNIAVDPIEHKVRWYTKPDEPTLDLAVMPFMYGIKAAGYEHLFLPDQLIYGQKGSPDEILGVGDTCYTIGLFRLVAGTKRNVPIVHTGTIALMAGQEPIPVTDWRKPNLSGKPIHVDCHLVETQSLSGLSGAPVFARQSFDIDLPIDNTKERMTVRTHEKKVVLFGIWQAAWEAPPGQIFELAHAQGVRVPVGMGCVVPAPKLKDLLEIEELKMQRDEFKRKAAAHLTASLDVAGKPDKKTDVESSNPRHQEDFTALLGAAAKKQKPDEQT